jgi:erythritol transport system ATP-binding protein
MEDSVIYQTEQVTKIFPGTVALRDVDYYVHRGQVNCLVGENGAGKSTLMKILAGVQKPTSGNVLLDGQEITLNSPRDAEDLGISIIYQELNLFPNMSVAENIFITREKMNGVQVDHKEQEEAARTILRDQLQHEVNPKRLVADLRVGQQQIVEIAKALSQNARILIMDEPTSALSAEEVEVLFKVIQDLKQNGVTVIYISHRLEEIMEIGDYVTVLRNGYKIDEDRTENIDIGWIVERMVGKASDARFTYEERELGEELFRADHITLPKYGGGYWVNDVSLSVRRGEILGLYGLKGAGRTETLECIMGVHEEAEGSIYLEGQPVAAETIAGRIDAGLALLPEDRKTLSIMSNLSVTQNISLASLKKFVSGLFRIDEKREGEAVDEEIRRLSIKVASRNVIIGNLSGGNQQKTVIGRWLLTDPKVLMLDEPTRGIDVGAKGEVFQIVRELARHGIGIIVTATELKEIMAISDRIIVLSKGQITGEFDRSTMTEEKLVRASEVGHRTGKTEQEVVS